MQKEVNVKLNYSKIKLCVWDLQCFFMAKPWEVYSF